MATNRADFQTGSKVARRPSPQPQEDDLLAKVAPPEARVSRGLARAARFGANATVKSFRKQGFVEARLITKWADIVGADLARATLPQRFRRTPDGGTLTVRASGAAALQLQHYTPQIIERVNAYFGHRAVTRLNLVQGPIPPRPTRGRRRPAPLPESEAAELERLTGSLTDSRLQAALRSLGRGVIAKRLSTEKRQ